MSSTPEVACILSAGKYKVEARDYQGLLEKTERKRKAKTNTKKEKRNRQKRKHGERDRRK